MTYHRTDLALIKGMKTLSHMAPSSKYVLRPKAVEHYIEIVEYILSHHSQADLSPKRIRYQNSYKLTCDILHTSSYVRA